MKKMAVVRPTAAQLKPLNLSLRQYDIMLALLRARAPLSARQLAKQIAVIGGMRAFRPHVDVLLDRGLLTRLPEDHDGEVRLTGSGRSLLLAAMAMVGATE